MKISPDNPHLQRIKTEIYHEALNALEFGANAKHAGKIGMSPSDYRATIRKFPFMDSDAQIAFILNWKE